MHSLISTTVTVTMVAKYIILLALAIAASASPLVPVAKVAYPEHEEPAHYDFHYSVHDEHTGDIKEQREARAGDDVNGSYTLLQPDGVHRIVEYTSDAVNGFNANVRYEGHPNSAPAPAHLAQVAKLAYTSPIAYATPLTKVAYTSPVAKVAYPAPVAKVAYAASPLAQVSFSSPVISYHH